MNRALVSLVSFWISWALFLAWLSNHRSAPVGRFRGNLPELTALEAWFVPALLWLLASWWSFCSLPALQPPRSRLGLAWRALLLGLFMLTGAFLIWFGLLILA